MLFVQKVFAGNGVNGRNGNSQNRAGANSPRNMNMPQRRGAQSMGDYYRSGGQSQLGPTNRTAGRIARIRPVNR